MLCILADKFLLGISLPVISRSSGGDFLVKTHALWNTINKLKQQSLEEHRD
ncbi:MAG: hypothetical protein ACTS85_04870 [Arsenophonus sp. NC-PG7-MAG3]